VALPKTYAEKRQKSPNQKKVWGEETTNKVEDAPETWRTVSILKIERKPVRPVLGCLSQGETTHTVLNYVEEAVRGMGVLGSTGNETRKTNS